MMAGAQPALQMLKMTSDVPVVTRDQVEHAKPDPDLFLAAAERLGASIHESIVVGDSVWDLLAAQRAGSGGRAGFRRVWKRRTGTRGRLSNL